MEKKEEVVVDCLSVEGESDDDGEEEKRFEKVAEYAVTICSTLFSVVN